MRGLLIRVFALALGTGFLSGVSAQTTGIVHDAEYYILEAQNRQAWAVALVTGWGMCKERIANGE